MDRFIDELDVEIRGWINEQEGNHPQPPHKRNDGVRVGGGGIIDRRRSQSPKAAAKSKQRGEEFLKKIEKLK